MITYKTNVPISVQQYTDLLKQTSLGERRPIDKPEQIETMLKQTDVLVTAWHNDTLVGLARSVTDFAYCCYLSDLAVSEQWQKQGIGQQLILETEQVLEPTCKIILLAAPQAVDYYPHIGFVQHPSAWTKIESYTNISGLRNKMF
ncbi:GNAT family N-acetyltransferase [Pasteurella multocida]|uniref:GNAT family N-acetyltransferase n=1 Tax=Pasteurella multocida TaxID=747 RepID=UPI0009F3DC9A|nr:GNAT family N-acetyltransferase [Pasteurella multocida]ATF74955.1 GNAT family N-acetyltransferase [Pasteurella multocida]ATN17357.1 GNAT family N-acetyltransferase [Pasteurella multocida]MEB3466511.1 GNAT family N-acetyltransferase [Pasteurella multocida]MEB3472735.1 GNAT family N-acetyltransferase [Pasteurella multocida]MEB3482779.1 GNAT family N-acetyltransferase [Pasteurella multocida]